MASHRALGEHELVGDCVWPDRPGFEVGAQPSGGYGEVRADTSVGAATAASAGAAGSAALGMISGTGAAGGRLVGSAAVLGSGIVIGQGYKRVRRRVRARQDSRRQLAAGTRTETLAAADVDENGAVIVDAIVDDIVLDV